MSASSDVLPLILVALALANLPWLNERLLAVFPLRSGRKLFWMRLLEWMLAFGLTALLAWRLEMGCLSSFGSFIGLAECPGELHPKSWEFFSVTLVLFAVFALPGFIYFVERRRRHA
ncbi:MAG: DUF2818 family protein [Pseudomonadota bacterium]